MTHVITMYDSCIDVLPQALVQIWENSAAILRIELLDFVFISEIF